MCGAILDGIFILRVTLCPPRCFKIGRGKPLLITYANGSFACVSCKTLECSGFMGNSNIHVYVALTVLVSKSKLHGDMRIRCIHKLDNVQQSTYDEEI